MPCYLNRRKPNQGFQGSRLGLPIPTTCWDPQSCGRYIPLSEHVDSPHRTPKMQPSKHPCTIRPARVPFPGRALRPATSPGTRLGLGFGRSSVQGFGVSGFGFGVKGVLGGSWLVISGVISPLIWVVTTVTLLITPLILTTPEASKLGFRVLCLVFGGLQRPKTPKPSSPKRSFGRTP